MANAPVFFCQRTISRTRTIREREMNRRRVNPSRAPAALSAPEIKAPRPALQSDCERRTHQKLCDDVLAVVAMAVMRRDEVPALGKRQAPGTLFANQLVIPQRFPFAFCAHRRTTAPVRLRNPHLCAPSCFYFSIHHVFHRKIDAFATSKCVTPNST